MPPGVRSTSRPMPGSLSARAVVVTRTVLLLAVTVPAAVAGSPAAVAARPAAHAPARPAVRTVSPAAGPVTAGTVVTITGTALTGASKVLFGTSPGSRVSVLSSTRLRVTAPAHSAGLVDVRVVTRGGTSAPVRAGRYRFVAAPRITELSRSIGPLRAGISLRITGRHLTGVRSVLFGTVAVRPEDTTETEVRVSVPAQAAGPVDVRVVTAGGRSPVVAAARYTYLASAPSDTAGNLRLVSVDSTGWGSNGYLSRPQVSDDGRYVLFRALDEDLVPGGEGSVLRDLVDGTTTAFPSAQGPSGEPLPERVLSRDGRWIGWSEASGDAVHAYVAERGSGGSGTPVDTTPEGDLAAGSSSVAGISDDGRWVLFASDADDLVADVGDDDTHLFLRDMTGETSTAHVADCPADPTCWGSRLTPDGAVAVLSRRPRNDQGVPGEEQVYVWDRDEATTTLVSVAAAGGPGDGQSSQPSISDDGRLVAFGSSATNLLQTPTSGSHAYLRDLVAGTTRLLDRSPDGAIGDGDVVNLALAGGGGRVALSSWATNLTASRMSSPFPQVFALDLDTSAVVLVSRTPAGEPGNGYADTPSGTGSWAPALSGDGRWLAFVSQSTDLVPAAPDAENVYLADLTQP